MIIKNSLDVICMKHDYQKIETKKYIILLEDVFNNDDIKDEKELDEIIFDKNRKKQVLTNSTDLVGSYSFDFKKVRKDNKIYEVLEDIETLYYV